MEKIKLTNRVGAPVTGNQKVMPLIGIIVKMKATFRNLVIISLTDR